MALLYLASSPFGNNQAIATAQGETLPVSVPRLIETVSPDKSAVKKAKILNISASNPSGLFR